MQQVRTYISTFFQGEARDQFARDVKNMAKQGWRLHTLTDEGVGEGQRHTGRLVAVYEKEVWLWPLYEQRWAIRPQEGHSDCCLSRFARPL
jgi:hypothetical protein